MKKYFMFATVAIASLFASCSNSDDFVAPQVTSEDVDSGDALVPIKIGVNQGVEASVTRGANTGTGTVGGIGTGTNNWYGQLINVYMFHKGTLTLATEKVKNKTTNQTEVVPIFDKQLMVTPGSTKNLIDGTPAPQGQAMVYDPTGTNNAEIKYYPQMGNYDFFGYHLSNAKTTGPVLNAAGNAMEADFVIDGSHDLMSERAVQLGTWPDGSNKTRFFSSYSARRDVHPNLDFKHLLTRLHFNIKAGDENAAGVVAGVQPDPYSDDSYTGIFVESIEIFSRTTGKLVVAWTADAEIDSINGSPITDDQKVRANKIKWDDLVFDPANPSDDANTCGWVKLMQRPDPTDPTADPDPSEQLVDLVHVAPKYNKTGATPEEKFPLTSVGEALIVSKPVAITTNSDNNEATGIKGDGSGNQYYMRISVSQLVKSNHNNTSLVSKPFATIVPVEIKDTEFKLGYSYDVNITLYGAEEIKVNTTIAPWESGDPIPMVIE